MLTFKTFLKVLIQLIFGVVNVFVLFCIDQKRTKKV